MDGKNSFRSAYSPQMRVVTPVGEKSMTHQSFKDECDINVLMSRYMKTGIPPESINQAAQQFLDCTQVDFQSAMQLVAGAASLFENLPSSVRNRFNNDPASLLAFVNDEANLDEAVKLGLAHARKGEAKTSPPLQTNPAVNSDRLSQAPADPALLNPIAHQTGAVSTPKAGS